MCASDKNYAKLAFTLRTVRRRREHPPGPSSDGPLIEKPEKTEGNVFVKMHFSVLAERPVCTAGPSATVLSDI
jgi:hypothetical protein